jgi:hypothetical protein
MNYWNSRNGIIKSCVGFFLLFFVACNGNSSQTIPISQIIVSVTEKPALSELTISSSPVIITARIFYSGTGTMEIFDGDKSLGVLSFEKSLPVTKASISIPLTKADNGTHVYKARFIGSVASDNYVGKADVMTEPVTVTVQIP